jgi:hypothetical protein
MFLAIYHSRETVAGFDWESTILATFYGCLVPCSRTIAHIFGDLSSGNSMTWVSEFGSEISVLL